MSGKRKALTLDQRVKIIERSNKGEKPLVIASSFGCGKTQIFNVIKDKVNMKHISYNQQFYLF